MDCASANADCSLLVSLSIRITIPNEPALADAIK